MQTPLTTKLADQVEQLTRHHKMVVLHEETHVTSSFTLTHQHTHHATEHARISLIFH